MSKVYIVVAHDDDGCTCSWQWNVKAFSNKQEAEDFAILAKLRAEEIKDLWNKHTYVTFLETVDFHNEYDENCEKYDTPEYKVEEFELQ